MGHGKLRKFAENETFSCLLQPSSQDLLADGYFNLKDHPVKGDWNNSMFRNAGEIIVELGCGKGEYTVDLARRNPDHNYIGVDIKGARLWKGAKYATENKMGNVAFLRTRIEFINAFFAPSEVSEVWLTFSDPQIKSENSRLTSPLFLERYRSFLKRGGIVHLKTDSRFLHEYTKAVCEVNGLKILACTTDLYGSARQGCIPLRNSSASLRPHRSGPPSYDAEGGTIPEGYAPLTDRIEPEVYEVQTFYEKMFLDQGYKITYLSFVIDHEGEYIHPDAFDAAYWKEQEGPRRSFGHQCHQGVRPVDDTR